ncbi:hypothetical protein D3C72_2161330 [compost metagenome]
MSTRQISTGVSNSTVLMKSWAIAPMMAAGRKASSTDTTKRRALTLVGNASAIDRSLWK